MGVAVGAAVVSGGSGADPRTPAALPGLPPPFLGTAVLGSGELTAAVDAYGSVVDLRPAPAGRALIENPVERQAAGTVAVETGIVPLVRVGGGAARPFWRADSVRQRYLAGTNVVRTVARFGATRVTVTAAAAEQALAVVARADAPAGTRAVPSFTVAVESGSGCEQARTPQSRILLCRAGVADRGAALDREGIDPRRGGQVRAPTERQTSAAAARLVRAAATADRRWLRRARPLAEAAPAWAVRLQRRSLLALRALTDRRGGAVAAGARDGWAYVWPRDAAAVALAFAAAGYRPEARRVARFLLGLDLTAAARFDGDGTPVPGRAAQGDAAGWTAVAARAAALLGADGPKTGLSLPKSAHRRAVLAWRDRADYWEGEPGDYLGNALAAAAAEPLADRPKSREIDDISAHRQEILGGLVRRVGDPGSGLDSAAAWAVRPFSQPALYPAARRTLLRLAADGTHYGIPPGEDWSGVDPWSAPTAWSAWSLAALANDASRSGGAAAARRDRRASLRLLSALRRSATPAGALPERVDAHTGIPRSTTPLAWSHAFAILTLRQLWP